MNGEVAYNNSFLFHIFRLKDVICFFMHHFGFHSEHKDNAVLRLEFKIWGIVPHSTE
jgi:hypothetical protein